MVWVDTKRTQVKNKAGKLKERETTILEVKGEPKKTRKKPVRSCRRMPTILFPVQVRVKAQKPGDKQLQEVLYSTEAHTDRYFCPKGTQKLISTGLESV